MTRYTAGTEVEYTITYLEMTARPTYERPSLPLGPPSVLVAADKPPLWYFLDLYRAVGQHLEWVDLLNVDPDELETHIHSPKVQINTLIRTGWPAGFFMLEDKGDACDLAYFGLVPEAIGLGLGAYLLKTAIHAGWDREPRRMTVQTCTLDHPRALGLYQKAGFAPVGQETKTRVLTRARSM